MPYASYPLAEIRHYPVVPSPHRNNTDAHHGIGARSCKSPIHQARAPNIDNRQEIRAGQTLSSSAWQLS